MKATLKDLEKELWLRARNSGEIKWTTKDGKEVAINEMSDSHIINTINMLYRNLQKKEEKAYHDEECWEALSSIGDTEF